MRDHLTQDRPSYQLFAHRFVATKSMGTSSRSDLMAPLITDEDAKRSCLWKAALPSIIGNKARVQTSCVSRPHPRCGLAEDCESSSSINSTRERRGRTQKVAFVSGTTVQAIHKSSCGISRSLREFWRHGCFRGWEPVKDGDS